MFDVALGETQAAGGEAGIGVLLAGLGIGGKVKAESGSSSQSRIQFEVPLYLPPGRKG